MNVQSINQNSFKGYDARPLKGFFMGTNHCGLADEMAKIGEKEGFKIYSMLTTYSSELCNEYKKSSDLYINHFAFWAQDVWSFVNEKIITSNVKFISEICRYFGINRFLQDHRKHIAGGNLFIVNNNGQEDLLIGKDDATKMTISGLKYNYQIKNIHVLPQMDYHLDLFIRPLNNNRILVADDGITLMTLINGLEKLKEYRKQHSLKFDSEINTVIDNLDFQIRKFRAEMLSNKLPQTDKIVKKLNKAGFETIRVPARIYEVEKISQGFLGGETFLTHDCNYVNANVIVNNDNEIIYITNKSNFDKELGLTPDLIEKVGFSFENEFVKSISPYVKPDKIYFVDGKNFCISKKMLKESLGGIHCMCAEIPIDIKEG